MKIINTANLRKCGLAAMMLFAAFSTQAQDTSSLLPVGAKAPDFTLKTANGNPIKLMDYKDKCYVLIDFWASWCPDCRKENPNMVRLYNKYKDKNIQFVGISFDDNKSNWENAIAKDGLDWIQVSELKKWKESSISPLYGIKWIPTLYLIDPQGNVVHTSLSNTDMENVLEQIME